MRAFVYLVLLVTAGCGGRTGLLVPVGDGATDGGIGDAGHPLDGGAPEADVDEGGAPPADADAQVDADIDVEVDADEVEPCVPGCGGRPCGPGEWVRVCAGTFTMGASAAEDRLEGYSHPESRHEVTLTRSFEILSTEATQEAFASLMGYEPSELGSADGQGPVGSISWFEAAAYCNTLSDAAGLERCYRCSGAGPSVLCSASGELASPYDCWGYRLPTEAEWEYAARAGDPRATYNGDLDASSRCPQPALDPIAWYCGNSEDSPHPVAALRPNEWGLYDMLGNVAEWCHDFALDDLGEEPVVDPWGGPAVDVHLLAVRGGSWESGAPRARAAARGGCRPDTRRQNLGLRPARTLP